MWAGMGALSLQLGRQQRCARTQPAYLEALREDLQGVGAIRERELVRGRKVHAVHLALDLQLLRRLDHARRLTVRAARCDRVLVRESAEPVDGDLANAGDGEIRVQRRRELERFLALVHHLHRHRELRVRRQRDVVQNTEFRWPHRSRLLIVAELKCDGRRRLGGRAEHLPLGRGPRKAMLWPAAPGSKLRPADGHAAAEGGGRRLRCGRDEEALTPIGPPRLDVRPEQRNLAGGARRALELHAIIRQAAGRHDDARCCSRTPGFSIFRRPIKGSPIGPIPPARAATRPGGGQTGAESTDGHQCSRGYLVILVRCTRWRE